MSNDSNDSNEPGNDTAGQTAFQVGDRVKYEYWGDTGEGVVGDLAGYEAEIIYESGEREILPQACLTLISRATPASAPAQSVDSGEQYDGEYVTEPQTRERMRVPQVCRDCAWDGLADYTVQGDFLPISGWRICKRCNAINGPYPLALMCISCMGTGRQEGSLCVFCRGTGVDPQYLAKKRRLMTDQEAANAAVPHAEPDVNDMPYPDGDWAASDDDPDGDEDWDDAGPDSDVPDDEDDDDPDDATVDYDDWQRTPATPAAAATPPALDTPALDTHTLELPVMLGVDCSACDGTGHAWVHSDGATEPCLDCGGTGKRWASRTIRLSDEAVDRLAGELAKRLPGAVRMRDGARY